MPYITQVAAGLRAKLTVFGSDYPTPDGTCVRDYIHVVDLAKAHLASCLHLINQQQRNSYEVFNIATGRGISVLELIQAFEHFNQLSIKYTLGPRRAGDAPAVYADATWAKEALNWKAELGIEEMVISAWAWQMQLNKERGRPPRKPKLKL